VSAPHADHPIVLRLKALHLDAGSPATREIARATGVSHTAIADALSGRFIPTVKTMTMIVDALGGDMEDFLPLYAGRPMRRRVNASVQMQMLEELRKITALLETLVELLPQGEGSR